MRNYTFNNMIKAFTYATLNQMCAYDREFIVDMKDRHMNGERYLTLKQWSYLKKLYNQYFPDQEEDQQTMWEREITQATINNIREIATLQAEVAALKGKLNEIIEEREATKQALHDALWSI